MVQNWYNLDFEIVLLLIKEESHVRGIAKTLGESHSTILRKLNKLAEENILDYKLEGRNKVFFFRKNLQARTYILNAERYKQIKLLKKYPEMAVIAEEILKKCEDQRLIIIFGSYAKFSAKKDSDIDVFVETKDKKVKESIESLHSKINVKIGDFNISSPLVKEIIKNHVILKGEEEFYEKIGFFK